LLPRRSKKRWADLLLPYWCQSPRFGRRGFSFFWHLQGLYKGD
jgi:hypothetical protein